MRLRIFAACGLALLCLACAIFALSPWLALGGAAAAFGIGCYLNRHRRLADTDALHLFRILLISGGAMTFMAALVATDTPLKWLVLIASTLPILPAYSVGFSGVIVGYTLACFFLFVMILASQPEKPRTRTQRENGP
jgi:hypothetical protein